VLAFHAGNTPTYSTGNWVTFDIPLADYIDLGLASTEHLAQLIIEGEPNTVFIDNVLFHN
jgi:hypothetical protein